MFTKTIHLWFFMRKIFLYTSMTNFFCTRIRTLLLTSHGLYTNPIYIQRFSFFPTHPYGSHKGFFIYTRCSPTQEFLSAHPLHTKILYTHFPFTYMYKKPFSFLYKHDFYSQRFFFFFLFIFGSFYSLGRHS